MYNDGEVTFSATATCEGGSVGGTSYNGSPKEKTFTLDITGIPTPTVTINSFEDNEDATYVGSVDKLSGTATIRYTVNGESKTKTNLPYQVIATAAWNAGWKAAANAIQWGGNGSVTIPDKDSPGNTLPLTIDAYFSPQGLTVTDVGIRRRVSLNYRVYVTRTGVAGTWFTADSDTFTQTVTPDTTNETE